MDYYFEGLSIKNSRTVNMDSLLLKERTINGIEAVLIVICDGVGSLENGGYASGVAVKLLAQWLEDIDTIINIEFSFKNYIQTINKHIIDNSNKKKIKTATTLTALLLVSDKYYICHLGDSRIYCVENDELICLTEDHISVDGKLKAVLGLKDKIDIQFLEGNVDNKVFLVCSDGLYKRIDFSYMLSVLKIKNKKEMVKAIESLTNYVIEQKEKDNITLAIVKAKNSEKRGNI